MIDAIDERILGLLQRNGRISNAEISRQVEMAPSAVLERIRKLEERGVIKGYLARLSPQAVGKGLLAFVLVRTDSDWAQHEADGDHVHHVIDDLASWLVDLADGLTQAR